MHAPDRHELNAGWTLPDAYGIDRLVLMPKNPRTLFAYWEITPGLQEKMREQYQTLWEQGTPTLRLHELDKGLYKNIDINYDVDNWYVTVDEANRTYYVEIGQILKDGRFITMLSSNTVRTPRDSISAVIDPRWRMFAFWQERYYRQLPGHLSSYELFLGSDQQIVEEAKFVE